MIKFLSKICLVLLLMGVHLAHAQGTNSFPFLHMAMGGRAQGMGNAFTGVAGDINSLYYNPAAAAFAHKASLMFYHAEWFEDISIENLSFLYPDMNKFSFSFGLSYLHLPEIDSYEINNQTGSPEKIGSFRIYNMIIQLGSSYRIMKDISVGLHLKYLNEKIDNISATGVAFDFGLLYKLPIHFLNFGFSVQNIGPKVRYDRLKENLPLLYRVGLAYQIPISPVNLALDAVKIRDRRWRVYPGIEVELPRSFTIRGGYQFQKDIGPGYSLGFGLHLLEKYDFNYVFSPHGVLGNTHRAEVLISFGGYRTDDYAERIRKTDLPEKEPIQKQSKPPDMEHKTAGEIPVPNNLSAEKVNRQIILKWDSVELSGARYNIYVKIPGKTGVLKVNELPQNRTTYMFSPNADKLKILFYVSAVLQNEESFFSKPLLYKFQN